MTTNDPLIDELARLCNVSHREIRAYIRRRFPRPDIRAPYAITPQMYHDVLTNFPIQQRIDLDR